jgi:cystathionine beta-lyase
MKMKSHLSKSTTCVQSGGIQDSVTGGVVTPIYPSTAIDYIHVDETMYPRYFNTPNQKVVAEKIAALENGERAIIFSTGMAAIMTAAFTFLRKGDHAIFQHDLYGGTQNAIKTEFKKFGIDYTLVDATEIDNIENAILPNTRLIFIETPSNPILKIVDISKVAKLGKKNKIITMIDNTFATPINQTPLDLGMDIVMHSATKYLGGHSDLISGVLVTSNKLAKQIGKSAINYGGSVNAITCYLLERSLKTLAIRVEIQNKNAMVLAKYLENHFRIERVYYPGLKNHHNHTIARKQMNGFGGMVSFEIKGGVKASSRFISKLKIIKSAVSLGGIETILCAPAKTSHAKISSEERMKLGIKDSLIRMSVGIEGIEDLKQDIKNALR